MPFYPFDKTTPLGSVLRDGLDDLRGARYKLAHVVGNMQQMSDQQIADAFGFANATTAAAAKAELISDVGKLLNRDTGTNCAQLDDSLVQLLNQFG